MTTKTNATHTPGPWHAAGTTVYSGVPGPCGNGWVNSRQIAACAYNYSPDRQSRGEDEANARLIAAAPALLEACEKAYHEIDTITGGDPSHPLANYIGTMKADLRAAILAAKGGAS